MKDKMKKLFEVFKSENKRLETDTEMSGEINEIFYNKGRRSIQYIGNNGMLTGLFDEDINVATFYFTQSNARDNGIGDLVGEISDTDRERLGLPSCGAEQSVQKGTDKTVMFSELPRAYQDIVARYTCLREEINLDKKTEIGKKKPYEYDR